MRLEVVDVEHDEGARQRGAVAAGELGLEPLLERRAVERAGQRVDRGLLVELPDQPRDLLAQPEHDGGDDADDRHDGDERRDPEHGISTHRASAAAQAAMANGEVGRHRAGREVRRDEHRPEVEGGGQRDRLGDGDGRRDRGDAERADGAQAPRRERGAEQEDQRNDGERQPHVPSAAWSLTSGSGAGSTTG